MTDTSKAGRGTPTQSEIDGGPHAGLGLTPLDYVPEVALVGTLAALPEHVQSCIRAYGRAVSAVTLKAALAASPSCEQSAEGYERYAAIREGHRNAAEDAWFSAIPSIDSRRAFRAGFDAGYNNRSVTSVGRECIGTKRDEDDQYTLDRSADLLEQYAEFVKRTCPDEIEQHPYLPELEKTAEDLRALAAIQPTEEKGRG